MTGRIEKVFQFYKACCFPSDISSEQEFEVRMQFFAGCWEMFGLLGRKQNNIEEAERFIKELYDEMKKYNEGIGMLSQLERTEKMI